MRHTAFLPRTAISRNSSLAHLIHAIRELKLAQQNPTTVRSDPPPVESTDDLAASKRVNN